MPVDKRAVTGVTALLVASAVVGGSAIAVAFDRADSPAAYAPPPESQSASAFNPAPVAASSSSPVSSATPSPTSPAMSQPGTSSRSARSAFSSSAALSSTAPSPTRSSPASASSPPDPGSHSTSPSHAFIFGWYPGESAQFDVSAIDALPVKPQVVNYYSGWEEMFKTSLAEDAYADGIETFVEMEPWNCGSNCLAGPVPAMTAIAAGAYDNYLTSFGKAIRAFGHPVLATFAHEMNGNWYPWGHGGSEKTTPAQWIAAWDHVVTVINAQAPGLVTWVWAPNVGRFGTSIARYWPGARYVDEVGLDGYLSDDSATYQSEFGQTVADVRALTSLPIWIAETGVNQDGSTAARLVALADAAEKSGLTGMLYFDKGATALTTAEERALASVPLDRTAWSAPPRR